MLTNQAILTYIFRGVAFTLVIAVTAVILGLLIGSVLALVRNYCPEYSAAAVDFYLHCILSGAGTPVSFHVRPVLC